MKFKNVKTLSSEDFKRLTGVRLETFHAMVQAVKTDVLNKKKTGRPNKLSIEDQVLMTLEYLRGAVFDLTLQLSFGETKDIREFKLFTQKVKLLKRKNGTNR